MRVGRFTVTIADCSGGSPRRLTLWARTIGAGVCVLFFCLPVVMGLGAKWSEDAEVEQLRATKAALEIENGNFRETTGQLTSQIQALGSVIDDLGARSALSPEQARAVQSLPAVVKARAAGGTTPPNS